MDFIELTASKGLKYCLVVIDAFSKWVEIYPTKDNTAITVAKALCNHYFPTYSILAIIRSDNGTHFVNAIMTHCSQTLGFTLKNHCAYHPQSAGLVERMNVSLSSNSSAISSSVPFIAGFNASWWFSEDKYRTGKNITTFNLGPKISTPPGMMWQCGGLLYWYLPFDWCGTCTLVHLQPAVIVITDQQLENSKTRRFFMTLIPSYGTANLATSVNKLWFSLKNLTNTLIDITNQLENDLELEAIKQMALQNRIALDLLLAAQGGVCEVVNDHCYLRQEETHYIVSSY
uniref:Integrase catalytic domain-containing protein n=1 Tax=Acanthochromis polyacanthus TaxID=80966 RepID=A0A3Q1FAR5_9TELE